MNINNFSPETTENPSLAKIEATLGTDTKHKTEFIAELLHLFENQEHALHHLAGVHCHRIDYDKIGQQITSHIAVYIKNHQLPESSKDLYLNELHKQLKNRTNQKLS